VKSRHVRAYSALLRLYPQRFRAEYRREMTVLFAQQLDDARSIEGTFGVVRLWARSLLDLIATAPTEHLEHDVLVAQPVVGIDQPRTKPDQALRVAWIIAALAPAFMVLLFWAAAPQYMAPMFDKPPEALGLPLGAVVMGLSATWFAIGVAVVGAASRRGVRLLAFLLFIFPATFAFVLGPALILILQNLAA
jgi:hypothetical protein